MMISKRPSRSAFASTTMKRAPIIARSGESDSRNREHDLPELCVDVYAFRRLGDVLERIDAVDDRTHARAEERDHLLEVLRTAHRRPHDIQLFPKNRIRTDGRIAGRPAVDHDPRAVRGGIERAA